jgi:CHASE3 domain sensor protein
MTRLSVRLALAIVCLAASASAAFLLWTSDQQARAQQDASREFTSAALAARVAVSDLRGAQAGYVAAGQGPDFWFARVTAIAKDLRNDLASLKSLASSPDASIAIEEATGALQDFEQMDRRARDFTRARQLMSASDLIFADGFDLTKKAADAVQRALTAELADRNGVLGFLKRREQYALAGAVTVIAIVLVLLLPMRREKVEEQIIPAPRPTPRPVVSKPAPRPVVSSETLADLNEGVVAKARAAAAPAAPPASPMVDMRDLAALCTDLAKVVETRTLPSILERTAEVLNAAGIVVWIADPDGRELSPILIHGYSPQLARRLGTIARDASNVTASAYRTGLLQTMKGDAVSDGAIAAPLVGPSGCVGVLAAEMKKGGEQHDVMLSTAAIIASQLATLVGPPSARSTRSEVAG